VIPAVDPPEPVLRRVLLHGGGYGENEKNMKKTLTKGACMDIIRELVSAVPRSFDHMAA